MKHTKKILAGQGGFTLIELILVIAILGILAVAVAPTFTNLLSNAAVTGGRGAAGAIQSGINTVYASNVAAGTNSFPATLDGAAAGDCNTDNPCFGTVVQPITSGGWSKTDDATYVYTNAGITQTYTYTPGTGTFQCTASAGTGASC